MYCLLKLGHKFALPYSSLLHNLRCTKNKISPLEHNLTPITSLSTTPQQELSFPISLAAYSNLFVSSYTQIMCLLQMCSYHSEGHRRSPTSYLNTTLLDPGQVPPCLEAFPNHPSLL